MLLQKRVRVSLSFFFFFLRRKLYHCPQSCNQYFLKDRLTFLFCLILMKARSHGHRVAVVKWERR